MKLLRLDLLAYGPFTRRPLEFPADGPNLHIVYGPNEAGKSTTLRAITGFFYGIEMQTGDAHLHAMNELRIGATLRHSDGQERAFVRKKGNRATLLDSKGATVDESALRAWLSISERKHFEQMFGLSHEQLRQAGAALADAKTDLGKMLFGASLDGTTLHQMLLRLDADAEKLLSSGGNAGAITKSLVAYREHISRANALKIPAKEWHATQAERDIAASKQQEISDEIVRRRTARHRLERLQRALPWVRQREDAHREIAAMGEVRSVPHEVETQRRELTHAIEAAEGRRLRAENALERGKRDRDALEVHESILGASARIRQLTEDLGKYKTELRDRPGVQKEIITYRNEQREHLRKIGWSDVEPRNVSSARVDEASLARIRKLEQDEVKRQSSLQVLRGRAGEKRALISELQGALAAQPALTDASVLRATWDHLRPDKRHSDGLREAEAQLAALEASCAVACAALAPWRGTPDEALALPVPAEELIRVFEVELAADVRASRDVMARVTTSEGELDELRAKLSSLVASGEPASPERVVEARSRRDLVWGRVMHAWSAGVAPSVIDAESGSDVPLATAYLATVRAVDELADRLQRDSERAAQCAALRREEAAKVLDLAAGARDRTELEARAKQRSDAWQGLWIPCGIEPSTPREMLLWRARHASLVEQVRRRNEAAVKLDASRAVLRDQTSAILSALGAAGAPMPEATPWLTLLLHAEKTLKAADEQAATRATLLRDLSKEQRELGDLEGKIAACESERGAWCALWGEAVARLRLPPEALPEQADVVMEGLAEIFRLEANCERQEARLKAIEKQMNIFEGSVTALVAEFCPSLSGTAIERADALDELHTTATKNGERRRALDEQVAVHVRELEDASLALDVERRRRDAMLRDAGCEDLAALDGAIARSKQAREFEARKVEAEKRLLEVGEGWSLEALDDAVRETDSDRVESEIAALDERLKVLEAEQQEHNRALGALGERQKKFSGADDAAAVFGEAHQILAQARGYAERYARLRLATALLRRGIESYRQKNEGAILRRASRLLEFLTLGRYQQLKVEYDGDKAKLTCLRGHEAVDVKNALSDGTLDQLYLSLRLASLEQHLDAQEPMPLVLDDIFIHFDDERAQAGLVVLAELAKKTQVLLLTHHARNLDLARSALDPGAWTEHRFASPAQQPQ